MTTMTTNPMTAVAVNAYIQAEIERFRILDHNNMLDFGGGVMNDPASPMFGISPETLLWLSNLGDRDINTFSPLHLAEMKKAAGSGIPHFFSFNQVHSMDTSGRMYVARLNGLDKAFFNWYWVLNGPFGNNI